VTEYLHVTALRLLAIALLMAAGVGTVAADERSSLRPIDSGLSVLESAPALRAYFVSARDALAGTGNRSWEALVFPSFQWEWAVYVERDRDGSTHVVCAAMETQLWLQMESGAERSSGSSHAERELSALRKADLRSSRAAASIAPATAAALERLWSDLLSRAEVPAEKPRCLDGTSFMLFEWARGVRGRGGWARCPQEGSAPAAALALLEELCSAARNPDAVQGRIDSRLLERIAQVRKGLH
jgi:hypothetical protein